MVGICGQGHHATLIRTFFACYYYSNKSFLAVFSPESTEIAIGISFSYCIGQEGRNGRFDRPGQAQHWCSLRQHEKQLDKWRRSGQWRLGRSVCRLRRKRRLGWGGVRPAYRCLPGSVRSVSHALHALQQMWSQCGRDGRQMLLHSHLYAPIGLQVLSVPVSEMPTCWSIALSWAFDGARILTICTWVKNCQKRTKMTRSRQRTPVAL